MKPIDGVVLNSTQVQVRGGTILNVEEHTFQTGQRVKVCWNFTKNCVREVVPDTDFHPIHDIDALHCEEEEDELEDEYIEDDDSIYEYLEQT